jgi:potassium-transporting ATPase potassium-binding subunit
MASVVGLYIFQRIQGLLPVNPDGFGAVDPYLALNTAVSFVTNTNWQNYLGEQTMSHLTQMAGLAVQNFVSAGVGLAVAVALIRGLTRRRAETIGNFWVDLTRGVLFVLLPLSILLACVLMARGVIQNFNELREVATVGGAAQNLPGGPIASQEAIKELGTNGGGPYNANSAHPYENPDPITNFLEMLALLVIPFALTATYGRLVGSRCQGWAVFAAMAVIWLGMTATVIVAEQAGNPIVERAGADQAVASGTAAQAGGNMEGKETRFGIGASGTFAASTTGTSTGAVNSFHDSYTAIGGLVPTAHMLLGEVSPGGVGTGLYSMLVFVLLAVVIAGLMVGRTPEWLGKKVQAREVKLAGLAILVMPAVVLVLTGLASVLDVGTSSRLNKGPHGLTEILYAFTSMTNNNGSAFAGLTGNTPFYNLTGTLALWAGRFLPILAVLAIAGSLAAKDKVPAGPGTFPTHTPLFVGLLVSVVLVVGALTFFPGARPRPDRREPPPGHRSALLKGDPRTMATPQRLFEPRIVRGAVVSAFRKLDPRVQVRNPVMFVVLVGSVLVTLRFLVNLVNGGGPGGISFTGQVALWLWFTVLFANFAEAMAEGRGKAQADELRKTRRDTTARRLREDGGTEVVPASQLRAGDQVTVDAGEVIPSDGEVVEGIASVDESAITGESAPVIREAGGDRSAVTGGTRVLSDWIRVRITAEPGRSFLDRMIALVEGAERQKTPNEIALSILLSVLTIIFLIAVVTLQPFAVYSGQRAEVVVLIALLVCLIPTTIGALLSAIGIAGMDRMVQHNVLAMSGRAVEAAGDVNTLLLDKTGTITLGNREATELIPLPGVEVEELVDAAQLSSLSDETPEGRSIVVLAKERYGLRGRELLEQRAQFVAFTAQTRMSGANIDGAPGPQGGCRRRRGLGEGAGRGRPGRARPDRRGHLPRRRHPAGGGGRRPRPGRGPPEGHRQGRHAGPVRPAPPHGHPHRHDHRRQPAHRGRHRQRGRSRRLPGPGHTRAEDGADPSRAGRRQADRHDRRRHQ